jgi:tRNA G18 (ribose-2'-O)-methylase SpoU
MTLFNYACQNPDCSLRFTLATAPDSTIHCPRCGSSSRITDLPFESASVPASHCSNDQLPQLIAVLDNLRSALNVGAILRTADGIGASKVYLCGITATPENQKVRKTALGAEENVQWEHTWDILQLVCDLKAAGITIWCLEGGEDSVNLFENVGKIPSDRPLALIIGSEINGVDPAVLKLSDKIVCLPMHGEKESLNAATAFGIAAYLIRYGKTIR